MHDLVTSAARREQYLATGLWNDETLVGRVARIASADPDRVAVVDTQGGPARSYAELERDAAAVAAGLRDIGLEAGDVASVQLPNRYEAVVCALAIQKCHAVINPLLPNYRRKEIEHVFAAARPKVIFTPAIYRGCDHPALVREAGGRGRCCAPQRRRRRRSRPDRPGAVGVAPRIRLSGAVGRPTGRGCLGVDLHVGDRGEPEGNHAYGADDELQCPRRMGRPARGAGRRRVDAVAGRSLHRLQLRPALRPVPRPEAGAPRRLGRGRRGRPHRSRGLLVHPGRDDVPAGSRRAPGARRSLTARVPTLRLRRCTGSGGTGRRGRRAEHHGVAALRIDRGARRIVVPTGVARSRSGARPTASRSATSR